MKRTDVGRIIASSPTAGSAQALRETMPVKKMSVIAVWLVSWNRLGRVVVSRGGHVLQRRGIASTSTPCARSGEAQRPDESESRVSAVVVAR